MSDRIRPRLRAHAIAPIPVALGVAMLGGTSGAAGQAQDDQFEAVQRDVAQVIGNVRDNDAVDPSDPVVNWFALSGAVWISPEGEVVYRARPDSCASGTDEIEYTYGANVGTAVAFVTLIPSSRPDEYTVPAGTSIEFDVRANDPLQENLLDVVAFSTPGDGTLTQLAPATDSGRFRYEAPDVSGPRSFTYTSRTDLATCAPHAESVTLMVVPNAIDDTLTAAHATEACVDVLANDLAFANGLQVVGFSAPAQGSVTLNPPGELCYTGNSGYRGGDSFDYTIEDDFGSNAVATVVVDVLNAAPVANPDTAATVAGVAAIGNLLANDTDPNSDELSVVANTQPSSGSVVIDVDGGFTYTPNAGFSGDDGFGYTIDDGFGVQANSIVQIAVSPSAQPDALSTAHATPVTGNVLTNDLGSALAVVGNTSPALGLASVGADGTVSYTPPAGFRGSETFQYTVRDASLRESSATVTVTVANAAPAAVADSVTTVANQAASGNVLANDSDPNSDTLTVSANTLPSRGTLVIAANGAFTYTPAAGTSGDDSFQYTVSDGQGGSDTATVSIVVAPIASNDSFSVGYEATINGNLLANDIGSGLQVVSNAPPANGSASVAADGSFSYSAPAGFSGDDSLTYTVADAAGRQATATATFAVASLTTLDVASGGPTRQAAAGSAFAQPLAVRLLRNGAPFSGQTVCFVVQPAGTGASATLSASEAVTDSDGIASVTATANPIIGSYVVNVSLCNQAQTVTSFSMQNTGGVAAQIPTLGHGALAMLAALLGWIGLRRRREH